MCPPKVVKKRDLKSIEKKNAIEKEVKINDQIKLAVTEVA